MSKKNIIAKLSVAFLSLSSITSYATTHHIYKGESAPAYVTIPNLTTGFGFNVAALWLKPGASNLNYVINNKELPAQSPTWNEQEVRPSSTPAFEVGLRYVFPNGEDATLDWTHLYSNTSTSIAADGVSYFLGPDYEIGPAGIPIRSAYGTAKFRYDVVNLDVGQFFNFGQYVDIRLFGGLSTGFLREETTATYTGNTTGVFAGPFSMKQDVTSNFTGIGPRAGIHADINTDTGFGILGEAAVSALIGSIASKTSYTGSAAALLSVYGQSVNSQYIADQKVSQVVPGLDAKLGINYKRPLKNNLLFTISAGYQAAVYVNAISQYIPGTLVTPLETGGIYVATMNHTLSNYSVQGPFLNFELQA